MQEAFNKTLKLREYLKSKILGQDKVIENWTKGVSRGILKLSCPSRPRGTFLLLGPTGTGKTDLVLETFNFLLNSQAFSNNSKAGLLRIDMSEFSSLAGEDVLKKLLGSSVDDTGILGNFLDRYQEGFILYDELEKANSELFTVLLQQLDAARIRLADHRERNLSNFFIVCTSNIAAHLFQDQGKISRLAKTEHAINKLRQQFSPEFVSRLGRIGQNILTFSPLQEDSLQQIAIKFIEEEISRHSKNNIQIMDFDNRFVSHILLNCESFKNGAREIRAVVEDEIQNLLLQQLEKNAPLGGSLSATECGKTILN